MPVFENIPGATPIDDVSDLIPTHITTRSELNEWEVANIIKAVQKYLTTKKHWALDINWFKKVHKDMFDETWKWAGKFRQKNYNLGADWITIPEQIKILVEDITHWNKTNTDLGIFEQSVRLHHRLVKIHPFINGNGRHARLVADIYLFNHGRKMPTWPDKNLIEKSNIRDQYISVLQSADNGEYKPLEIFTAELL